MSYDKPITNNFQAVCSLTDLQVWNKFSKILRRKKKSRITVNIDHLSSIIYQLVFTWGKNPHPHLVVLRSLGVKIPRYERVNVRVQ